jgi:hypothetical protein
MTQNQFFKILAVLTVITIFSVVSTLAQPTLTISSTEVEPGDTFQLELTLDSDGKAVSALSTDITFDTSVIQITGAEIGPASDSVDKMIIDNDVAAGTYRLGILSISNNDAIEDGIVAYINGIVENAASEQVVIISQNASGSDPDGLDIIISSSDSALTIGSATGSDELPENIQTYIILTDNSVPLTLPYGSYIQVFGSTNINTINIEAGARVQFQYFIGANKINIEEASSAFRIYRSGATVYLNSASGTRIEIAATQTPQTLRFAGGSSELLIIEDSVSLGKQIIDRTESVVESPVDGSDTSESIF